jgi:hypothetical protein
VIDGRLRVQLHYKYLVEPDLGNSGDYVSFDGKEFNIKPEEAIRTRYEHGATLSRLVRTASRFAGAEKVGVHKIAANNPNVIDVEIAFTKSGEADETSTAPRMDIGALVRWPSGEPRLVFCEAKCANNAELSKPNDKRDKDANGDLRISVVSQILQYQQFIADNETPLINAYVNVCKEAMCVRPLKSDSITAASIYHAVDREHPTLLIDEADNLGLAFNGALRAVLNSGHRRGGKVTRYHGGQARSFATFAPVAVAAIGTLPLPVMHRFTCPQSPESANCRRGTKPNALSRPGQSTLRAIWAKHACCCSPRRVAQFPCPSSWCRFPGSPSSC